MSDPNKVTVACRVARIYLEHVNSQDAAALGALFASPTDYVGPDAVALSDPAKIAAGYERGFKNMGKRSWKFRVDHVLPFGENGCLLEFSILDDQTGEFKFIAVDHFEVNAEGKITRFVPFFASPQLQRVIENNRKHSAS